MRSALAALVAVALVTGAVYLRTTVIAPEGPGDATDDGSVVVVQPDEDVTVLCDSLLGDACPAGSTMVDLAGLLSALQGEERPDVLVAPSAVVDLVEQSRTSRAALGADRIAVATTALVATVAVSRDEVVGQACPTAVTWSCLADLLREGSLAPGVTDPVGTTEGIAAFAALTGGFLGSDSYSSNALGGADFFGWLDAVQSGIRTASDPLNDLILFGGARNDAAVLVEARALDVLGRAATNVPDLFWPTPLASLSVVAVGIDGTDQGVVDEVGQAVGRALQDAGWRGPDGAAPSPEAPVLDPAADGLPNGGVLFALRDRW